MNPELLHRILMSRALEGVLFVAAMAVIGLMLVALGYVLCYAWLGFCDWIDDRRFCRAMRRKIQESRDAAH